MKDFTKDSLYKHILFMAIPIALNMILQTMTNLVDVYFVGQLGEHALAGVSTSGNINLINMLVTQVLFIGLMAIVSHAIGRKDFKEAKRIYSHGIFYGVTLALGVLVLGELFGELYLNTLVSSEETYLQATHYLFWFVPLLSLQVIYTAFIAPMYAVGLAKPFLYINICAQLLNVCLTPTLIGGVSDVIPALGVSGAALASFISGVVSLTLALYYLCFVQKSLTIDMHLIRPNWDIFKRVLKIGLPSGATFLIYFINTAAIYWALNQIGSAEQAGFGLGGKVGESLLLPAMAIAFASPSIAGQNYAAGEHQRVRSIFTITSIMTTVILTIVALLCFFIPERLVGLFSDDASVVHVASSYLHYVGLSFPVFGLIFTMSGMFQALGNTLPSLISAVIRMMVFTSTLYFLSSQPYFNMVNVWGLIVFASILQAVIMYLMLGKMFNHKLNQVIQT